jgi:hypothetical protein
MTKTAETLAAMTMGCDCHSVIVSVMATVGVWVGAPQSKAIIMAKTENTTAIFTTIEPSSLPEAVFASFKAGHCKLAMYPGVANVTLF